MRNRRGIPGAPLLLPLWILLVAILPPLLSGCGDPKEVGANNRKDLLALPVTARDYAVRGIGDEDVEVLARFVRMECLDLASGRAVLPQRVTTRGFRTLASLRLPALRSVLIARSSEVDDEALRAITSHTSIGTLILTECGPFGRAGLEVVATLPRLTCLDLRGCQTVTDDCVPVLKALRSLDGGGLRLTGTGISEQGLGEIREALGPGIVDTDAERWQYDR